VSAGVYGFDGGSVRQAGAGGSHSGWPANRTGRRWGLSLADRVLLVAVSYRTNVTYRSVALLFGISKSAASRVVDHLAPLLALAPVTRAHGPNTVLMVDGDVGAHPRPANVRVIEKLPILGHYVDPDRRQHPVDRRRWSPPHQATATTAGPTATRGSTDNVAAPR
jgi:hypothetical protein